MSSQNNESNINRYSKQIYNTLKETDKYKCEIRNICPNNEKPLNNYSELTGKGYYKAKKN